MGISDSLISGTDDSPVTSAGSVRKNIRAFLAEGRPLLFDGAMGTYFASKGHTAEQCERANTDSPEEIRNIHLEYLKAGAGAIKTNTFAAGRIMAEGNVREAGEIIRRGSEIAIDAADEFGAFVFGDMGPVPDAYAHKAGEVYCRLADLFLEQGISCFVLETLSSSAGVKELAKYLKEMDPDSFLLVSFAAAPDGFTADGNQGVMLVREASQTPGVDAAGFNCMSGARHLLKLIEGLDTGKAYLSVMPNAGYPTVLGRHAIYNERPQYFAECMSGIVRTGAGIIGGCCGTTPAHIAAAAAEINGLSFLSAAGDKAAAQGRLRTAERNDFWEKFESGKRVIAVEFDPPADDNCEPFNSGVRVLADAGADIITIADCPIGRPRADSSLLACKIKREAGIEAMPHMTCRDRNLNATKALLLGLSMENIHNVLLVTGDPIPTADRDEVKSVFNFNSRKLARYVSSLNESVFHTPFRIFGALNLNVANFDVQLKLAVEKEANGVSGFLTQPVLSEQAFENLKLARQTLKGRILGGIFPVVSHRNAVYMNNEIAGMHVGDEIIRLYEGRSKEEAEELAVRISTVIAEKIEPYTDGIYLMTPFRRVELMAKIIEKIR